LERISVKQVYEAQNKTATFAGRGSVELVDALGIDLFLSIQRCTQARLTRSLPIAGVGKVSGLERASFHPGDETTPEGKGRASD
jgi:hypothetical protein